MRVLTFAGLAAVVGLGLMATAPSARAQVSVGVDIGVPPVCPYGYYDVPPYQCAPYGYYGPEWFAGGIFIGAGPWFHGPERFMGHVDNRFHPDHGYKGPFREGAKRRRTRSVKSSTSRGTRCATAAAT